MTLTSRAKTIKRYSADFTRFSAQGLHIHYLIVYVCDKCRIRLHCVLRLQKLKRLQEATGVDVGSTTTAATASAAAAAAASGGGDGESNSSSSGVNVGDMKAVATVGGKMSSIQQEIDNCREPLIGTVTPPPPLVRPCSLPPSYSSPVLTNFSGYPYVVVLSSTITNAVCMCWCSVCY